MELTRAAKIVKQICISDCENRRCASIKGGDICRANKDKDQPLTEEFLTTGTCPEAQWEKYLAASETRWTAAEADIAAKLEAQKAADIAKTEKLINELGLDNVAATRSVLVSNGFVKPEIATELEVKELEAKELAK